MSATSPYGTDVEPLTIVIGNPPAPVITSGTIASGTQKFPFNYQISGSYVSNQLWCDGACLRD